MKFFFLSFTREFYDLIYSAHIHIYMGKKDIKLVIAQEVLKKKTFITFKKKRL